MDTCMQHPVTLRLIYCNHCHGFMRDDELCIKLWDKNSRTSSSMIKIALCNRLKVVTICLSLRSRWRNDNPRQADGVLAWRMTLARNTVTRHVKLWKPVNQRVYDEVWRLQLKVSDGCHKTNATECRLISQLYMEYENLPSERWEA